jgi:hypothetical protein
MPVIKKQAPLLPEGEYCAQARKVGLEWSKPKPLPNGGKSESVQRFRIPLWLPDGRTITKFIEVSEDKGWLFNDVVKSGELVVPEGEEFILQPDDLEGRRLYFGIKHVPWNGTTIASVKFHSPKYACEINPDLEGVTFENEAPRGVALRAAKPAALPIRPPPEAPKPTATTQPPAAADDPGKPEDLTDDEFASAMEYARKLKRGKGE